MKKKKSTSKSKKKKKKEIASLPSSSPSHSQDNIKTDVVLSSEDPTNDLDSSPSESDEIYPHQDLLESAPGPIDSMTSPSVSSNSTSGAFTDKLALFSPQKKIPKRVSPGMIVDTVFSALFTRPLSNRSKPLVGVNDSDEDCDSEARQTTESDDQMMLNEDFVKAGLAGSLFQQHQSTMMHDRTSVNDWLNARLIERLVAECRTEDYRTTSARIYIVRAIHKQIPSRRMDIAAALSHAVMARRDELRLAVDARFVHCTEHVGLPSLNTNSKYDHGHGFVELLRYVVEHVYSFYTGTTRGVANSQIKTNRRNANDDDDDQQKVLVQHYMQTLVLLIQSHGFDPTGTDEDELLDCAGQFVAHQPDIASRLLWRLLKIWPRYSPPANQIFWIQVCARVVMTASTLVSLDIVKTFYRQLEQCIRSSHVQLAKEAMAFCMSPFSLNHYVATQDVIYTCVSTALHRNTKSHWNGMIQELSDQHFDLILDFAP